jgi:eukaryotic-like serine/threonine-protein kinase
MDPNSWAAIESLYQRALERRPDERSAWLQQACAGDVVLLEEVESLLANADAHLSNPSARSEMAKLWHHIAGNSDIDSRAPADAAAADSGASTAAATTSALPSFIGPYRILRLLGEGGMGVVYEAEQEHPRRTVALKIIRSGLTDPKLIRRFEHELLALGRLQHPGIAQIYEAGTAETGFGPQPYFAMELVHGQPLLEYADAHRLTTHQRLELMARVCDGVHHAHQRGIIHRDLKPGNILVDETGQPKILDFGVARATDGDAWMTHQTDLGQIVGTLAYMSPEQVLADPLELDTRSDVYALGVVLYQMLARRLPYKISSKLHEAVRTIQEDEPAPLSTISSAYRGDIETIVCKALEKDKTRRYASAAELADDIHHYLHDEPIMAHPPSTLYQLQKLARRHKGFVAGTAAVFVVLIAGIIVSTREAARANNEAATSRAISDFLQNDLLAQASAANQARPNNKPDPDLKVRTALDRAAARITGRFERQPEVEAAIRDTIGQTYTDLGLYPEAQTQLKRALDLRRQVLGAKNPETLKTMERVGYLAYLQGNYPEAETVLGNTLEMLRQVSGPEHPDTLKSMADLAIVYREQGKYAQAEALSSQTLEIRRRVLGLEHPDTLKSMNNLASVYISEDKYEQAEALDSQTLEIRRRLLGPEHPATLQSMVNLSIAYFADGEFARAEALDTQVVEIQRRVLGSEHPGTLASMHSLAGAFRAQGKYSQAESLDSQTVEIQRRILGPEHPDTLSSLDELARDYAAQGDFAQAEALFRETLESERRVLGREHPDTLSTLSAATKMYQQWRKYALAENYAAQALAGRRHALGSGNVYTMVSAEDLALAYLSQGRPAEAEPLAHEALEFNQKDGSEDWDRFRAESLLGASLAGQKKYAEAEPLLLEGYKGMEAQKDQVLMSNWYNLDLTRDWLVKLYRAWGRPKKAAEWSRSPQEGNIPSTK